MKDHKDLDLWKKSMNLIISVYDFTQNFSKEEMYGLTSQIRISVISIPSNISEGAARNYDKEFIQFQYISLGSSAELETQIMIAERLGYLIDIKKLLDEIGSIEKMLNPYYFY
ncbi:MAG: four helix bundle protein [Thermodesulfobacteriota bacterium]|nr:four helix bundle protein [Thermodesulfobacteriota bacterium]